MNMLQYSKFCVGVALISSISALAEVGFSYEKNTFINYYSCLGIYTGTSLDVGEKVWLFSVDQSPAIVKIAHVIPAADAQKKFNVLGLEKVYSDQLLRAEIGCVHPYRGDMPESLARMSPEPKDSIHLGIVIRGLPTNAWISEGRGEAVSMDVKDNPYVRFVRSLADTCYVPDSLIRARRFPTRQGRSIIQLDIGKVKKVGPEKRKEKIEEEMRRIESVLYSWAWPEYKKRALEEWEKKDFLESVEICRFFLDGERVLQAKKISRVTGVEERVDTVPDLNTDNWADTTDHVIGFISLNEGKDWDVLVVDVGWEGINYSIRRLTDTVVHYDRYLYTYH